MTVIVTTPTHTFNLPPQSNKGDAPVMGVRVGAEDLYGFPRQVVFDVEVGGTAVYANLTSDDAFILGRALIDAAFESERNSRS